jgi:glycosyltransferase involved in cell wall biosynthesis
LFAILSFALAGVQVLALTLFHASLDQVVNVMMIIGIINLLGVLALHRYLFITVSIQNNADALISLIFRNGFSKRPLEKEKLKILFFNWRDTRHVWAGGAEVYVQRIAKNLVADGHKVTVFCGNDGNDARNQVIDGVQIVRRGGFYTVYIWAFLYYVLRFRGAFDVVVDCENGIPFFTPLYVSKPKLLLIHHVHQEVFRSQLKFPFSLLAEVIEGKLMPLVYHNQPVVTVSESSQKDIERIGLGGKQKIAIVHSGVDAATSKSKKNKKTLVPSFLYLGRLKPYKNIDVAIKAFKEVLTKYPKAILNIAGDGENRDTLIKLTQDLGLSKSVIFLGKVSEEHKHQLLASSWIMVQPSDMEGWGITVIEANTYSTPVIASDTAGLRDSVQDGKSGILVPPRDSDLLAKAMVDLVKNSKRRRLLSKNALEWSKQFSWKRSTKEFLAVIRSNIFESVPALKLGEVHHGK